MITFIQKTTVILALLLFSLSNVWAAEVTIQEFGGYQDPYSGKFFRETLPQIQSEYGDKVELVFRHFPLPFHQFGEQAAEAAECARKQDKFDDYHYILFNHQEQLETKSLIGYASQLNLNTEQFTACLEEGETKDSVEKNRIEGTEKKVSGTPTFFLDGKEIGGKVLVGAQSFSEFKSVIDEILQINKEKIVPTEKTTTGNDQQSEPILGANTNAPVQILAFSDFSSPFAKQFHLEVWPQIQQAYPQNAKMVYRNFPLSFYPFDATAALAGECAHAQGKFEDYAYTLYSNQSDLSAEALKKYAANLHWNVEKFNACLDKQTYLGEVQDDQADGEREEVNGVPWFFISGPGGHTQIVGSQPFGNFQNAIEYALGNNSTYQPDEKTVDADTSKTSEPKKVDEKNTEATSTYCSEGDRQFYTCVDTTQVSWCTCIGGEWKCIDQPDQSCPQTQACNGCMMNDSCLAAGTRMIANDTPSFCGLETKLETQKKDGSSCQNNFECLSNTCNTGTCINLQAEIKETRNVIQQLFDWLGGLFGRR